MVPNLRKMEPRGGLGTSLWTASLQMHAKKPHATIESGAGSEWDTTTETTPLQQLHNENDGSTDTNDGLLDDTVTQPFQPEWPTGTDPFADRVVSFSPGPHAGFGQNGYPEIVLGSPEGRGATSGSLNVLSLGQGGTIILEMTDLEITDGPGPDLLVFENPFLGWFETAAVAASMDGETWHEWPCDAEDLPNLFPGCAGVSYVHANSDQPIDPTSAKDAGGDTFDLAAIGLPAARFIRIRDSGRNFHGYGETTGGFDLDAVAAANWSLISSD